VASYEDADKTTGSVANTANSDVFGSVCNGFVGDSLNDVWYTFIAGSENINITAQASFDVVLTLFSGGCNNLTQINCSDSTSSGIEEINASGLTVGDTYYFRMYSFGSATPPNPNFEVAVWTPQTLSNSEVMANTEFSYFPNPVRHTLTLKAQNNIETVTVYNMVGQAVLRVTPNAVESDIYMQTLSRGTYFAQVTIAGVTKTIKVLRQ
jgi:hypothetical protein